jgi:hypothetical protein
VIDQAKQPAAPVTIGAAARALAVDRSTIQGWLRRGAPSLRCGEPGRGHGALVDLDQLRRWRYGELAPAQLDSDSLATAMAAAFERPATGYSAPIWAELDLSRRQAAVLWVLLFCEIVRSLTGKMIEPDDLPIEMRTVFRISIGSI